MAKTGADSFSEFEMRIMDIVVSAKHRQLEAISDPEIIEQGVRGLESVKEEAKEMKKLKREQQYEYEGVVAMVEKQLATLNKMVNFDADMDIVRARDIIREVENKLRREKSEKLTQELEVKEHAAAQVTSELKE